MSKLTTGPFVIPPLVATGVTPDQMSITLVNPTGRRKEVTVYLTRAASAVFPVTSPIVTALTQTVILEAGRSTLVRALLGVQYQVDDTVRVTIVNDIDEEGEKIEASVVVGSATQLSAVTFFNHNDLFETDNIV
jgi:hypothetical protein